MLIKGVDRFVRVWGLGCKCEAREKACMHNIFTFINYITVKCVKYIMCKHINLCHTIVAVHQ